MIMLCAMTQIARHLQYCLMMLFEGCRPGTMQTNDTYPYSQVSNTFLNAVCRLGTAYLRINENVRSGGEIRVPDGAGQFFVQILGLLPTLELPQLELIPVKFRHGAALVHEAIHRPLQRATLCIQLPSQRSIFWD